MLCRHPASLLGMQGSMMASAAIAILTGTLGVPATERTA